MRLYSNYLGDNKFTIVAKIIYDCPQLEVVDFTKNQLSEGMEYLLNSASITNIYLRNNCIKLFPFHLINCKRLLELNLMENNIENIPEDLLKIKCFHL